MSQSTTMTIRVSPEVKDRLELLAEATQRSKSFLASEAILDFIEINEWQISEIEAAVKEADAGDFANDKEINDTFKRWGVNAD
jgi:RHH-type transcriptional regulator, rel operon repressor / antitoxin RelB